MEDSCSAFAKSLLFCFIDLLPKPVTLNILPQELLITIPPPPTGRFWGLDLLHPCLQIRRLHRESNLFYDPLLAVGSDGAGGEDPVAASRAGVVAAGTRALLRVHAVVVKVVTVA